jgi:hypothetical protein
MEAVKGCREKMDCRDRLFLDDLLSKKFRAQKVEAGLKVMLYNKFMNL